MLLRVSHGFAKLPDVEVVTFTQGVITGMTGNAAFPSPPVTLADLQTAHTDFHDKVVAATSGGPPHTAAKNNAKQSLLRLLRRLAAYVQIHCDNDMAVLLSSGFLATNTNRVKAPLYQPQGLSIKNGSSGQLTARVDRVRNTSIYEGRVKGPTGDWLPSVFTRDSQHITFAGLVPGTVYTAQVRALGGSTGQSDWSDPSSHMAT